MMVKNRSTTPGQRGLPRVPTGPALVVALLALILVGALILLAADRPASAAETLAQKLEQATEQAAKVKGQLPLKVPAAEFASVGGGAGQYTYSRSGGFIYAYDDYPDGKVKGVCLRAPVYLPDGVRVNEFRAYVLDKDAEADISRIELLRAPYRSAAGSELMASMHTSGDYFGLNNIQLVKAPSVDFSEVDNGLYSYLALVCLDGTEKGSTLRLYSLVVDYGYKTFLPAMLAKP